MNANPESQPSFSTADFAAALESQDLQFEKNKIVRGKAIEYAADGAYVEIGSKAPAFLPRKEISLDPTATIADLLPLQTEREFLIVREQNADGEILISIRQLEVKQAWEDAEELNAEAQPLQVRVIGSNRGGLKVVWRCLQGFVPRSHLLERDDLESYAGQEIVVLPLEVDSENNRFVLSQRQAVRSNQFAQLQIGQLVEGTVSGIQNFGVFVDLGSLTALLHIRQISQSHVDSLHALFQPGQEIKAIIVNLDNDRQRISLSTKVLENRPGEVLQNFEAVMETADARAEHARKNLSLES